MGNRCSGRSKCQYDICQNKIQEASGYECEQTCREHNYVKCHDNLEDVLNSNEVNKPEIKRRLFDLLGSDDDLKNRLTQNKCDSSRFENSHKNEKIGCKLDSVQKLYQCTYH